MRPTCACRRADALRGRRASRSVLAHERDQSAVLVAPRASKWAVHLPTLRRPRARAAARRERRRRARGGGGGARALLARESFLERLLLRRAGGRGEAARRRERARRPTSCVDAVRPRLVQLGQLADRVPQPVDVLAERRLVGGERARHLDHHALRVRQAVLHPFARVLVARCGRRRRLVPPPPVLERLRRAQQPLGRAAASISR